MIKIITDEDLVGMSQYLTPDCQDEPCSNCLDVKAAIKRGDIKQFRLITHWPEDEAEEAILSCHRCLWYWVDDVVSVEPNYPLTLDQLQEMDGEPVWVVNPASELRPFWMLVDTEDETVANRLYSATFEDYGTEWLAYRRKPDAEKVGSGISAPPAWAEHFQSRFEKVE